MGEFFRGRKSKSGVLTLVLACVFMAGWVRNYFIQDSVKIPTGNSSSIQFISGYQCLNLIAMWSSNPDKEMASFRIYRHQEEDGVGIHAGEFMLGGDTSPFRPTWFRFGNGARLTSLMTFSLPYWSITIPLTLISFCFLISKPCQSKPKTPLNPFTSEEPDE